MFVFYIFNLVFEFAKNILVFIHEYKKTLMNYKTDITFF